ARPPRARADEVEPEPSGGMGWLVLLVIALLVAAGLVAGGVYLYRVRRPPADTAQDDGKVDAAVKADAAEMVKQAAAGKGADFLRERAPKRLSAWRQAAD